MVFNTLSAPFLLNPQFYPLVGFLRSYACQETGMTGWPVWEKAMAITGSYIQEQIPKCGGAKLPYLLQAGSSILNNRQLQHTALLL